MKIFRYVLAAAIIGLAAVSCEVIGEDAFSKAPVAPQLYAHADILMTSNTMEELVNFSWKPARFLGEGLTYDLYGTYEGTSTKLSSTTDLFYKVQKTDFKSALYAAFPNLPENNTFTLSFYVSVTNGSETYASDPVTLDIYAYGDAVSADITPVTESVVLDVNNPSGVLELLSWEPARLGYNEDITYNVYLKYLEGNPVQLAVGLTETSFSTTVDELNEAAVAAGAPEAEFSYLDFFVKAFSASVETGVISNYVSIGVETYIATYPEYMYLPGGYQGWDPASAPKIPHSSVRKGYYEGVIDLSVEGGGTSEFKFSPVPAWEGDFSIDNIELTTFGNGYTSVSGSGITGANIAVPSGVYNVVLNKKVNTLYMIQIETLSLIGEARVDSHGWADDVDFVYDPGTNTYRTSTTMQPGEFKIRVNHDWTHSAGGESLQNISFTLGQNLLFDRQEGEYDVMLDINNNPYVLYFVNTSFPEQLYIPGSHQGWNPATAPVLKGNSEGLYEGFVMLTDFFKFTSHPDWNHTNYGGSMGSLDTDPAAGNLEVPQEGYYYLQVDLSIMSVTATLIHRVAVIGSFTGWGDDVAMEYNADLDEWKATNLEFSPGTEYKFRMNVGWDINFGGDPANLTQDGANLKADAGTYNITLSLATTPYYMVIEKTGEVVTEYDTHVVLPGDYSGHNWDQVNDPWLFGSGDGTYKGALTMYNMEHGFKFVESGTWIGGDLVAGTEYEFDLYSGDNMMLPNGTFYWEIDLPNEKAFATPVKDVGIIGSFEGSNWGTEVPMVFDPETLTYSVTVDLKEGNEFKIRFNNDWNTVLGGDITQLTYNGDNISVQKSATYTVVLDMANTASLTLNE
jgi:hypothetical protein